MRWNRVTENHILSSAGGDGSATVRDLERWQGQQLHRLIELKKHCYHSIEQKVYKEEKERKV